MSQTTPVGSGLVRVTVASGSRRVDLVLPGAIPVAALVVNRMHPPFTDALPEALRARVNTLGGSDLGGLYRNLADFALVASREEEHLAGLAEQVDPAPIIRVPFLRTDVHDLTGLALVGDHLFARARA